MYITLNCCEQNFAATFIIALLHMRFQNRNRLLHYLSALKHKWKLHLALTKELPHYLHARKEMVIDNCKGFNPGI